MQSRIMSLVEAVANVVVGHGVAVADADDCVSAVGPWCVAGPEFDHPIRARFANFDL